MKNNEFHEIILAELKDLKSDLKEVRQVDIPSIQTSVTGFRTEIDSLKRSQAWSTRLYTIIGGAIAVLVAKFTGTHN